jgi:hypothetical protein
MIVSFSGLCRGRLWHGPFGWHAVEHFMGCLGLGFLALHQLIDVVGRAIKGVKPQEFVAGILEIVHSTSGHNNTITALDWSRYPVNHNLTPAFLDAEKLIMRGVGFRPDILPGFKGHKHQLQVLPGIEYLPEVMVFFRQIFDVGDITFHGMLLLGKLATGTAESLTRCLTCASSRAGAG